ncbi:class I SAM-dependent methyltransferase [Nocardioides sp.]|uniref:class I SAM-dependent methyltransferase n=1 Tax=Nocardioides sp. TaxID=35761 RepID=UPI003D1190F8
MELGLRRRTSGDGTTACLICGSRRLTSKRLTYARDRKLSALVVVCGACGYNHLPEHVPSRYRSKTDMEELPNGHPRLGTRETPGREFHMSKMGLDILGGRNRRVLMYGAGRSLDNHHIAALPEVSTVAISDIMKVRDDAEFIDANDPPRRAFDVVVASEVIEHFRNPHEDFARLLRLVSRKGLLVCGTNIHDGGMLTRDRYIYYPDHTSYYSPRALRLVARRAGVRLDFRSPLVGQRSRKRYVLMSRSSRVMDDVADYFGREPYAPSEVAQPRTMPQRSHQQWRSVT